MEKFKEYWKTVIIDGVEHPRYMVSNLGRVKCKWLRNGKWNMCKLSTVSAGYYGVEIDGRMSLVHRLVAEAFLPNPQNKHCIDHIFTLKTQNVVLLDDNGNVLYSTIRWCTHKENQNNMFTRRHLSENNSKPWLGKFGSENNSSKPIVQLTLGGQFIKKWDCMLDVERELGIRHGDISRCCNGIRKSAGGFKWMYYEDWVKKTKKPPVRYINHIKSLF